MKLLHQELSYKVRGCAIDVRKNYGPGHKELIYQRALVEELKSENLKFQKEEAIEIYSPKSGKVVGTYRPDFIIEDKIVVELKSLSSVPKETVNQLYTYLRNSKFELGFLINFGGKRLTIKRVVYSNNRKAWFKRFKPSLNSPRKSVSKSAAIRVLKGKAWKFGDDINTDVIYPGKYLSITTDLQEMAQHCFETVYPDFLKTARPGAIIVAGKNYGCGSSREQAAACLKYFGISLIIAESFARIFFRNAINLGLPVLTAPGITQKVKHNDTLEIDLENGIIKNMRTNEVVRAAQLPPFILKVISAGGLIPYLKKRFALRNGRNL